MLLMMVNVDMLHNICTRNLTFQLNHVGSQGSLLIITVGSSLYMICRICGQEQHLWKNNGMVIWSKMPMAHFARSLVTSGKLPNGLQICIKNKRSCLLPFNKCIIPSDFLTLKDRSRHQICHPNWFSSKGMVKDIFLQNGGRCNAYIRLMFKQLNISGIDRLVISRP